MLASKNVPDVKLGIVAVSRDCFPIALSERRRAAMIQPTKPVQTKRYCASSSDQASGALIWRKKTPSTTTASSESSRTTAAQ